MTLDISSLTIISSASDALSNWELAGYITVAAVTIGVIGEAIHDFTDWFKKFSWWKNNGGKASVLLLIVALAGELLTQIKVNVISGEIISFLNKETASAIARAEEANKATEEERIKRLDLEKSVFLLKEPRTITTTQRKKLINALKEFKGTAFELSASDNESITLALDIEIALTESGWIVKNWSSPVGLPLVFPGKSFSIGQVPTEGVDIHIYNSKLSLAKNSLVNILKSTGFQGVQGNLYKELPIQDQNRDVVFIHVGT